jgi:hypothetical protein
VQQNEEDLPGGNSRCRQQEKKRINEQGFTKSPRAGIAQKKMRSQAEANTDQRAHEEIDTEIPKGKTLKEHRAVYN